MSLNLTLKEMTSLTYHCHRKRAAKESAALLHSLSLEFTAAGRHLSPLFGTAVLCARLCLFQENRVENMTARLRELRKRVTGRLFRGEDSIRDREFEAVVGNIYAIL
jgi:hypothetical protein